MQDARVRRPFRPVAVGALAAALAFSVYLATAGGSLATTDAVVTFEIARSLVERGAVDGPPGVLWEPNRGADGRYYSQFGLGQSVFDVPFYVAGRAAERLAGGRVGRPDSLPKAAVAFGSAVAAALSVWLTFLLAWRVTASPAGATFAALALAFGTLLWPYSKFGFNAPLAAACLLAATNGLWAGTRQRRDGMLVLAGLMLGAGLFTRHEFVLAALPAGAWLALESRGAPRLLLRRAVLTGSPFLVAVAAWLWFNDHRFGNPLYTGYVPAFANPLAGLYGLLLTPGASLFVYCPVAVPAVAALVRLVRRDLAAGMLLGGQVLVFLLFYATLVDWEGGRSYGPRYLVPVLPYLCVALGAWFAAASQRTGAVLLAWVVASSAVQLPGVLIDFAKVAELDAQRTGESHVVRHSSWRSASIVLNATAAASAIPRNVSYLLGRSTPPPVVPGAPDRRDFSRSFAFSLDFWWLYAFYLRIIRAPAALACGAAPLLAAAVAARRLRRVLA